MLCSRNVRGMFEECLIDKECSVKTASLSKVAKEWWHIVDLLNPADRNSRLVSIPDDVKCTPEGKKGSYFLKIGCWRETEKDWPLEINFWPMEKFFWPLEKKDWPMEINGATEAFNKKVKRSIFGVYGNKMFTSSKDIRDVSKQEMAKDMELLPRDQVDAMMGVSEGGVALLQKEKSQPKISSNMIISMLKARTQFLATCSEVWMKNKACWMGELDLCGREMVCYYVKNKTE